LDSEIGKGAIWGVICILIWIVMDSGNENEIGSDNDFYWNMIVSHGSNAEGSLVIFYKV
jgi:hypothetical protein